MNSPLRWLLAVALLLATPLTVGRAGGGETQPASGSPTHFVLVRHAEKEAGVPDPGLDATGVERAAELARLLADVPLDALYASQYRRTSLTLGPLAAATELDVRIAPVDGDVAQWASETAATLLERHRGGTVVIAGHSNTVPLLARALGAAGVPDLTEADYDDLFWVVVEPTPPGSAARVRWTHLHYGPPSE